MILEITIAICCLFMLTASHQNAPFWYQKDSENKSVRYNEIFPLKLVNPLAHNNRKKGSIKHFSAANDPLKMHEECSTKKKLIDPQNVWILSYKKLFWIYVEIHNRCVYNKQPRLDDVLVSGLFFTPFLLLFFYFF